MVVGRVGRGGWRVGQGWTRMVKAGRDRPRLAEIGRGRPRLAGVGRDWPRFAEIGRDWPRCAKISRGWPEIRRERPSLASFCVGTLSRCLTSLTLGFRFREIHWLLPGPALGARQMGRLIDPLVVNLSISATHDFGRCRRWGDCGRSTTRSE